MISLYICLGFMVLAALTLLYQPCKINDGILSNRKAVITLVFFLLFPISFYLTFLKPPGLAGWLSHGKRHYELVSTFNKLGGVESLIKIMEKTLEKNPNDSKGWALLSKLYASQGKSLEAEFAKNRANLSSS